MAKAKKSASGAAAPAPGKKPEPHRFPRWFLGHVFSALRRHGNIVAFWVGIGYCARQASLALIAFSGKTSTANLQLGLLANISFVWTVSVTLSGVSIALYLRERRLHRETIRRLSPRAIERELSIDPTRTSSQLTEEGKTRKEDE